MTLLWIVLATFAGGVLSVVIAVGLTLAVLKLIVRHLVSLSAGVLLGTALATLQGSVGQLAVGGVADLVLLSDAGHWAVSDARLRSQGKSTPFSGYELPGRVLATLVGGHIAYEAS